MKRRIHIGSDHAGFDMKELLKAFLKHLGYEVVDHGTHSDQSTDYPDYAHPVSEKVLQDLTLGILLCGSANGMCMTANKHQGIRAALCWNAEIARLARQHNNANILCVPARFVSTEDAETIARVFLETDFEGGRHANRVNKIACQ